MQVNEFIKNNRIIGVVGNSGSGKSTFVKYFKQERKVGVINLDIIKVSNVEEQIEYYVRKYNYRLGELKNRKDEIIKMLEIDQDLLNRDIYEISESELSKVLIASVLLYNPDTINNLVSWTLGPILYSGGQTVTMASGNLIIYGRK